MWLSSADRVRVTTGPMVAHRRLFPGISGATSAAQRDQVRAVRSARSARASAGAPKGRSSPTRSTTEYADSTPSARISRDPISTCPASAMHGSSAWLGDLGDAVRHLAGAGGEVEGPLAGDHQVGRGQVGSASPTASATSPTPGVATAAEEQQREAEPAGGAGALLRGHLAVGQLGEAAAASRRRPASRSSGIPFCGPKILVAPMSPSSGLSTSLAITRSTPANRSADVREVDRGQLGEPGRAGVERAALGGGAERGQQPGAAVVGAGAAEPDDDPRRRRSRARREQLADPAGVAALGLAVLGLGSGAARTAWALSTYAVPPTHAARSRGSARRTGRAP